MHKVYFDGFIMLALFVIGKRERELIKKEYTKLHKMFVRL